MADFQRASRRRAGHRGDLVGTRRSGGYSAGESTTNRPPRRLGRNTAKWRIFSGRLDDKPATAVTWSEHGEMADFQRASRRRAGHRGDLVGTRRRGAYSAGESTTNRPPRRLGWNTAKWRIFSGRLDDKPATAATWSKHGDMADFQRATRRQAGHRGDLVGTRRHGGFSAGDSTTSRPPRRLGRSTAKWRIFSGRVDDEPATAATWSEHGEMADFQRASRRQAGTRRDGGFSAGESTTSRPLGRNTATCRILIVITFHDNNSTLNGIL